jgi:hypothetical protein
LVVFPDDVNPENIDTPVVHLTLSYGATSGRFSVPKMILRVFPAFERFARDVMTDTPTTFPAGPYPTDSLTYKGPRTVEYKTPANTEGLGTPWGLGPHSIVIPNNSPIEGVAILIDWPPDLMHLSVRLPSGQTRLIPEIIHQAERDAGASK